jgi:putative nucleotidyltransferase with HDIG domain
VYPVDGPPREGAGVRADVQRAGVAPRASFEHQTPEKGDLETMSGQPLSLGVALSGEKTLPPELQKALAKVTEINSLPEVTARIVEVVEDPRATAHDMHEIVRSDPALAAKILKVVNSAFYGLPAQIASLDRAIVMLGLSAVKNIALAASLSRLFNAEAISEQFAARDLWRHCVAVGVCARTLAQLRDPEQIDEAFVGGLVHDLGLIASQQLFPEKTQEIANICMAEPREYCAVEREEIGADHQILGVALAVKWKFPPRLQHAIAFHHEAEDVNPEFRWLTATIYVADSICCRERLGYWLTAHTQEPSESILSYTGLTEEHIQQAVERLPALVKEAERVFAD